jgi:hypothetical protein
MQMNGINCWRPDETRPKRALNDAIDSNVQDGWNPDKKTVQKRGPRKKKP